jgi:ankyrin repeat protein
MLRYALNNIQKTVNNSWGITDTYPMIYKKASINYEDYPNPNISDLIILCLHYSKEELLCYYTKIGRYSAVEFLLKRGAEAKTRCNLPLCTACKNNDFAMTMLLFKYGAHVDKPDGLPVVRSIEAGNTLLARYLLMRGADINANNGNALQTAAYMKNQEAVKLCIDYDADIDSIHERLQEICKRNNGNRILEYINTNII